MPEPGPADLAAAPDFPTFALTLSDPLARAAIGVHISDEDAALLARRSSWALTFYRQWRGEEVASERGAPIALPRALVLPRGAGLPQAPVATTAPTRVVLPVEPGRAPTRSAGPRSRPLRVAAITLAVGTTLAAGLVGAGIAQAGATASSSSAVPGGPADPFPPGLAGPDAPAGSDAPASAPGSPPTPSGREARLGADLAAALDLDKRTAALPSVSGVVQKQLVYVADLACLQGYDETLSSRVAQAVSGQPDLDEAAGAGVADAIARYCASAPANG
ncbi:MAG: hypothetical protein HY996_08510 [Micrococcales bacterium]|nr:hypothetical protein [Micrococcales bacterium]